MIHNFPYTSSRYSRIYNYYPSANSYYMKSVPKCSTKKNKPSDIKDSFNKNNIFSNIHSETENLDYFEFFGIKLFFDDILLIFLILFLYNEGIKDQYLFIALILLLLS